MKILKTEARKLVNHAKWAGFELPDGAEEHLAEFSKQDYIEVAQEIAQNLLEQTFPHIAFGRDPSRTSYPLNSIVELPRAPHSGGRVSRERVGHVRSHGHLRERRDRGRQLLPLRPEANCRGMG